MMEDLPAGDGWQPNWAWQEELAVKGWQRTNCTFNNSWEERAGPGTAARDTSTCFCCSSNQVIIPNDWNPDTDAIQMKNVPLDEELTKLIAEKLLFLFTGLHSTDDAVIFIKVSDDLCYLVTTFLKFQVLIVEFSHFRPGLRFIPTFNHSMIRRRCTICTFWLQSTLWLQFQGSLW